jgi:esterase/lipase
VIEAKGVHKIFDKVQSRHKELLSMDGAGNVITQDPCWEMIAEGSNGLLQETLPEHVVEN